MASGAGAAVVDTTRMAWLLAEGTAICVVGVTVGMVVVVVVVVVVYADDARMSPIVVRAAHVEAPGLAPELLYKRVPRD